MVYTLCFCSSKCSLFHNSNLFGSCIIHILYTGVLKLKKNHSGAKRLSYFNISFLCIPYGDRLVFLACFSFKFWDILVMWCVRSGQKYIVFILMLRMLGCVELTQNSFRWRTGIAISKSPSSATGGLGRWTRGFYRRIGTDQLRKLE